MRTHWEKSISQTSYEQILKASKISGVHYFLGKHESGYDLIVDEPTNMMDELSENTFKKNLSTIVKDKTVIIVTHKPSLLSIVDRLIVVEDGKVVADGPKEKIIASFGNKAKPTNTLKATRVKRVPNE